MFLLECQVMPYAWGSRTAIAELRGLPAAERPEAELWMGAHPLAPSRAITPDGERWLGEIIEENPHAHLGADHASRFGSRLPFLMKVLAADEPLSLQAHPSREQARAGFAREEAAKVPLGAPHRSYKDENHKPELLCALGPFEALSGFRDLDEARTILRALGVPALDRLRLMVDGAPLRDGFAELLRLDAATRVPLVRAVAERSKELAARGGQHARAYHWAAELAAKYPGDAGVVSSLLLRHVELVAGEAIFLPAGNLHAYLRGVGIEIMASSDNVLRGGLTPKHVDVEELLDVLDFDAKPPSLVSARPAGEALFVYPTAASDFELSRIEVAPPLSISVDVSGPEIVFAARGDVTLRAPDRSLPLKAGATAFIPASTHTYSLDGTGTVFRATAGR